MSAGLDSILAQWALVDRSSGSGGVRASFARRAPIKKLVVHYTDSERKATLELGGRKVALALQGEKGDPSGWRCDCPAAGITVCLHTALAARGLTDEVDELAQAAASPPDAKYAIALNAPAGLAAAAARTTLPLEPFDDGVRVAAATVRREGAALTCDCPMAKETACLHRLLVSAWARGERTARGKPVSALASAQLSSRASVSAVPPAERKTGEKLSAEDVERFEPLLGRIETLIAELVTFGLQRVTAATLERVDALTITAQTMGRREDAPHHAGLGRLFRLLQGLRQSLEDFKKRLVTTTEHEVLLSIGRVRNLVRALRANTGALPLFEFAGAIQQEYEPVPVLDVQGIGFESWITLSGFAGVTAYVLDLRTGRVLTRTNTLPKDQADALAAGGWGSTSWQDQLASQPAFAGTSVTYLELANGRFLLSGAMVAKDVGRLSGSSKTQVAKRPKLPLDDPKLRPVFLMGAGDAVRFAQQLEFDPLGRPQSSAPVAIVPITGLSPTSFDELHQRILVDLHTEGGACLACALNYRDEHSLWFDNLDFSSKAERPPRFVLCKLGLGWAGLSVEPLTAWFETGGQPAHLTYRKLEVALRLKAAAAPRAQP